MNNRAVLLNVLVVVALLISVLSAPALAGPAPKEAAGAQVLSAGPGMAASFQGPVVSEPVTPHVVNIDVRTLPTVKAWKPGDPVLEIPRRVYPRSKLEGDSPAPPARPSQDLWLPAPQSAPSPNKP